MSWHRHHRGHRHGCRPHGRPGGGGPVLGYLRARLHRRLFVWFGLTIFCTALASGMIFWVFGSEGGWQRYIEGSERFIGDRFAHVWSDPDERDLLARTLADDIEIGVRVSDVDGTVLHHHGPEDCRHFHPVSIVRDRTPLGEVALCKEPPAHGGTAFGLVVAAGVLWLMSGFIAFRLTRPLAQLVRVTRDIGNGRLDSRMKLGRVGGGELALIGEAVNDMAARIEKQIGDQRELLAAVSHEIRTPLGHLRVLLDILRDKAVEPRLVDDIEQEVMAIDAMVGQLLASSRVDFGTLDPRPLDGVELAIQAIERADLDPTLLSSEAEKAAFEGDAALVLQALANLLRNAAEHGGGAQGLVVARKDQHVTFEVTDDGPGFADADLDRAFDSFAQGRTRPGHGGSLGLGLSLVRRIARAHGGEVWARNTRPGAAVGFSVRITPPEPEAH